jgi:hypothetical protein
MLKSTQISAFLILFLSACAAQIEKKPVFQTSVSTLNPGESELGLRVIFHNNYFTDINDFNPVVGPTPSSTGSAYSQYKCLGDVTKVFYANGADYSGTPTAFPTSSTPDFFSPTYKPIFIRNVSVDITNTFYPATESNVLGSDVCSYRAVANSGLPWTCADFDRIPAAIPTPTVVPTPTPIPTPVTNEFFNSGYYRVRDDFCAYQGPQASPDVEVTKALVGGVNIDLDRTKLGSNEDLLMVLTYHAMGEFDTDSSWPASVAIDGNGVIPGTPSTSSDHTVLKVHLMATAQALDQLIAATQPRSQYYSDSYFYPIYLREIATLEDQFGGLRSEQVYIPLSQNILVDRIRIERNRGSFHLFQVDLYRLGNRGQ